MAKHHTSSRRDFLASLPLMVGGSTLLPHALAQQHPPSEMTIQEVIDVILEAIPGAPREDSVDTVKTGDPSQAVTGIVTSCFATGSVIQQAVHAGANFIITHEPTFYNHLDETDWLNGDTIYNAKRRLIDEHGIVVWRFHDYWHQHQPDGILTGMLKKIGWERYVDPERPNVCVIPEQSLGYLTTSLKEKLSIPFLKTMGNPLIPCKRVGMLLGAWGGRPQISLLSEAGIDVMVCGEVNEWETAEYVRDAIHFGHQLGLIVLGHAVSEEEGMAWLVDWLQPRLPDVAITHIPATDPFMFV